MPVGPLGSWAWNFQAVRTPKGWGKMASLGGTQVFSTPQRSMITEAVVVVEVGPWLACQACLHGAASGYPGTVSGNLAQQSFSLDTSSQVLGAALVSWMDLVVLLWWRRGAGQNGVGQLIKAFLLLWVFLGADGPLFEQGTLRLLMGLRSLGSRSSSAWTRP